jgi:hypothetical protein
MKKAEKNLKNEPTGRLSTGYRPVYRLPAGLPVQTGRTVDRPV